MKDDRAAYYHAKETRNYKWGRDGKGEEEEEEAEEDEDDPLKTLLLLFQQMSSTSSSRKQHSGTSDPFAP